MCHLVLFTITVFAEALFLLVLPVVQSVSNGHVVR